jgi:hypothetical protein
MSWEMKNDEWKMQKGKTGLTEALMMKILL